MPLDSICTAALVQELKASIEGARIDKIQQPERSMLLFSIRVNGENKRLLLAAGTGNARVHVTQSGFENPAEPPMFCMLMRKHLTGARILSVDQPDRERMIELTMDCRDEMGIAAKKRLMVEMFGRSSNMVLVAEDGRILDCLRRVDYAGDISRRLLPGMIYRYPPKQNKLAFWEADDEQFDSLLSRADPDMPADRWLLDHISGLSPLICRELAARGGGQLAGIREQLFELRSRVLSGDMHPYMLLQSGKPMDFSFMPITQYGDAITEERFSSFSELLDAFYSRRDREEQQRRRSHELMHSVKTSRDRLLRKLVEQKEELRRTENKETVRRNAELITANMYRLKKGEREAVCEDYYQENCPQIRIPLDPLKTPQQNAAALFKKYNKLKGAEQHLTILIGQGEQQLEYLNSVLEEIERAESEKDLSDIRRELTAAGFLRTLKGTRIDRGKAQAPLRYVSDDGLEILVGRSNVQNDELTTKIARRTDYWLHTQKVHGSHVILRCDGLEPPARSLEQAASLAVYHSQARGGGKTPVDYTMVRFVRKPSGALPGKVLYTDYKTIVSESDEALANRLKKA